MGTRDGGTRGESRGSALWGNTRGGRGRSRGRRLAAGIGLAFILIAPFAIAAGGSGPYGSSSVSSGRVQFAYLPDSLITSAEASPTGSFHVIVQGAPGEKTGDVANEVRHVAADDSTGKAALVERFRSISAVAAELTGEEILALSRSPEILAVTPDAFVRLSDDEDDENEHKGGRGKDRRASKGAPWKRAAGIGHGRGKRSQSTVAVVDSGVDASRPQLLGRIAAQVDLTSTGANSRGDGRGHGTFIAGLIADASPTTRIVSVDVFDDRGRARTSDVIEAAEWILRNRDRHGIRVANFSLHASTPASIRFDPLDRAVERLWLSGITVVTSAGNHGVDGRPTRIPFAPGNDPFVITVGASDTNGTPSTDDDTNTPWSAYGYTLDGFAKPELGAPGRRVVGLVPPGSTMALERPDRIVGNGLMRLSGTSLSAAVVSGAAAEVLREHPSWTPDEVKGALMVTARHLPRAALYSLGVGVVDAARAADLHRAPNPNLALNAFVVRDPSGSSSYVFDAASWESAVEADPFAWDAASWHDASWHDASWHDASWHDVSWSDVSWSDVSWSDVSWSDVSWSDASWFDASWFDVFYPD